MPHIGGIIDHCVAPTAYSLSFICGICPVVDHQGTTQGIEEETPEVLGLVISLPVPVQYRHNLVGLECESLGLHHDAVRQQPADECALPGLLFRQVDDEAHSLCSVCALLHCV